MSCAKTGGYGVWVGMNEVSVTIQLTFGFGGPAGGAKRTQYPLSRWHTLPPEAAFFELNSYPTAFIFMS